MKHGLIKVGTVSPEIALADPQYNAAVIKSWITEAEKQGVKLLVFPELCVTAYTCGDLFRIKTLLDAAETAVEEIARATGDMLTFVGAPLRCGGKLYNCAVAMAGGKILGVVPKSNIPNYSEFYELRHFAPAPETNTTVNIGGTAYPFGAKLLFSCDTIPNFVVGAEICEDAWVPVPPSAGHCAAGATVVVNLSASDEVIGKDAYRRQLVKSNSAQLVCAYLYADAGEGESTTDLVFSGHSLICENGIVLAERMPFADACGLLTTEIDVERIAADRMKMNTYVLAQDEHDLTVPFSLTVTDTELTRPIDAYPFVPGDLNGRRENCRHILAIQAHGLAKRLKSARAQTAVIGISGGLDSCLALLAAANAADILHRDRSTIVAVTMPCFGTTSRTRSNAETLCRALGVTFREIPLAESVEIHFRDIDHDPAVHDVVYENAQARERTQILMDLANKENGIVVGTGDLSELALGWATYNGDHMSMYGVNASVPKTLVRHIVAFYADQAESTGKADLAAVLRDILDTPVSPELLPAKDGAIAQITEDIVGPYALHDFFLYYLIRFGFTPEKIYRFARHAFAATYSPETILHWLEIFFRRFITQQYKRSCLPDGPKVGTVALSPRGDWRMPSDASAALWMAEIESIKQSAGV